jgi:hypothetical protein
VGLTFVVGRAADVFSGDLARAVDGALHDRFAFDGGAEEKYESEPVEASGWRELQRRVHQTLDVAPHLTTVDAYQAVYIPAAIDHVEHVPIPNVADPLQVASLSALVDELRRFAASASLPTDDVELMQLGLHYLEAEDVSADLDVQTYVQLMLSAKQAIARRQALWIVT